MHSHPWEIIEIHKFEVLHDKSIVHSIVELSYDALVQAVAEPQLGYALEKTYLPPSTRKKGRPIGSKNKKKTKQEIKDSEETGSKNTKITWKTYTT